MKASKTLAVASIGLLLSSTFSTPASAGLQNPYSSDAHELHELLRSSLPEAARGEATMVQTHLLPDAHVVDAQKAGSVEAAMDLVKKSSLAKLTQRTALYESYLAQGQKYPMADADAALARALAADPAKGPITIVVAPGIFGEFIPTRAFEDVLEKPSADRDAFEAAVKAAAVRQSPNATDDSFDNESLAPKAFPLNELVSVGSIVGADGKTQVRIVVMKTPMLSLESMGSLDKNAANFNRRLEKYLTLTGRQNLIISGYSRGTDLALEMLAQAYARKANWLRDVKAMVAFAGVTWGSTLADDGFNPASGAGQAIPLLRELIQSVDPNSFWKTSSAYLQFIVKMLPVAPALTKHKQTPNEAELKQSPITIGLDAGSIIQMVKTFWTEMGLNKPITNYAQNVRRTQGLFGAILEGAQQLTTDARKTWWKTHNVPLNIPYYTMSTAMANPEASDLDRQAFEGAIGYSRKSYDDISLLQNRLDYEAISGVSLNDSQVSVAQMMFLPAAVESLNPANKGLDARFLGTAGTHHWGLALRVCNAMKDGRTNPFPREALLKAVAAKVVTDAARKNSAL